MTPDPLDTLIADCRALIATMRPVIDRLAHELAGGVGPSTSTTWLEDNALDRLLLQAGNKGSGVPGRSTPPAP